MKITEKLIKTTDVNNLKMIDIYLRDQLLSGFANMRNQDIETYRYRTSVVSLENRLELLWDRMAENGMNVPISDFMGYNFGELYCYC